MQSYRYATSRIVRLSRNTLAPRRVFPAYSTSSEATVPSAEPIHEPIFAATAEELHVSDKVTAQTESSPDDHLHTPSWPAERTPGRPSESFNGLVGEEGEDKINIPTWRPPSESAGLSNILHTLNQPVTSSEVEASGGTHEEAMKKGKRKKRKGREEHDDARAFDEETASASIPSRPLSKTQRLQLLEETKRKRLAQLTEARKARPDSELTVLQDPHMAEAIIMARRNVPFKRFEKAEEDTINALQQIIDNPPGPVPNASVSKLKKRPKSPRPAHISPSTSASTPSVKQVYSTGEPDRNLIYPAFVRSDAAEHVHNGQPPLPLSYVRRVEGLVTPQDVDAEIKDLDSPSEHRPIARLAHGLDRVLFNPGVHWLKDPRSHVFNFTPWLQKVPKVHDFDFERVQGFIKSSLDSDLAKLAKAENCLLTGSTSSLTGMLSQIYIMLSREKLVDTSILSEAFRDNRRNFTPAQKLPVSVILRHHDGVYSTDSNPSDPGLAEKNVLTWMGTMLEKFLTTPEAEFTALLKSAPSLDLEDDGKREAYRYARFGDYVMRSQLDCHDPRLPGTGVFDIKTRAALPIRVDLMNWEENSGYLIRRQHGTLESFEREYYDLIRSAFLKYSFQARIGNMDGVFVTYHNTDQIFGFQYVPLEEMDERVFGNKAAGALIFKRCLRMLEIINKEIINRFPGKSISTVWDSYPEQNMLRVFAEPVDEDGHTSKDPQNPEIMELDVYATNYLDNQPRKGWSIPEKLPDGDWTIHYKMFVSSRSPHSIRHRRKKALEEQASYWALPAGMTQEEADAFFENIDYGGRKKSADDNDSKGAPRGSVFKAVDSHVEKLRELARKGKRDSERAALARAGTPHIVYGEPQVFESDVARAAAAGDAQEASGAGVSDVDAATDSPRVKPVREVDDAEVVREQKRAEETGAADTNE